MQRRRSHPTFSGSGRELRISTIPIVLFLHEGQHFSGYLRFDTHTITPEYFPETYSLEGTLSIARRVRVPRGSGFACGSEHALSAVLGAVSGGPDQQFRLQCLCRRNAPPVRRPERPLLGCHVVGKLDQVDLFAQKYIYVVAFGFNEQTREPLEASFFGDINRFERASVRSRRSLEADAPAHDAAQGAYSGGTQRL